MQNIATIYRFNTPFLDIHNEKTLLISVKNKLKNFLQNQGVHIVESLDTKGNYNDVFLVYGERLKIQFKYIKEFKNSYYMPIFKMDLYLDNGFLDGEKNLKKTALFLTSLFECFDGLNEKEYLIDINDSIYYKSGLFGTKVYPSYDFQDISQIQKEFEKNGEKLLEDFIKKYQNNDFILTKENSKIYHKIHAIILYYIYLVYIMYKSVNESQKVLDELDEVQDNAHIDLVTLRLKHVNHINIKTLNQYYKRLEVFFNLFKTKKKTLESKL